MRSSDDTGVFIFEGYFGFNPTDPNDNYVYAKRSGDPLTLRNFIKNFELGDIELPAPIADSGFYGETIFSYSLQGRKHCTKNWSFSLRISSDLLKKTLMENLSFCVMKFIHFFYVITLTHCQLTNLIVLHANFHRNAPTMSFVCEGVFLRKYFTVKNISLFLQKSSIRDVLQGPKYSSVY